jgi:hypothetical protein
MRGPASLSISAATSWAMAPPGGSYCSQTSMRVPEPSGTKRTDPTCAVDAPGARSYA